MENTAGDTSENPVSVTQTREFTETFKHRKAVINGSYMHYVVGGQGPAVVLIHGFPQTWYMWRKVMLPLAERYTVVAAGMRGLGDSNSRRAPGTARRRRRRVAFLASPAAGYISGQVIHVNGGWLFGS